MMASSLTNNENITDISDDTLRANAEECNKGGEAEMNKNEYNNALELFTKGIGGKCDDDQLNADLYTNRATAHFNLGNYHESLSDAKAARKFKPTDIKAIARGAVACVKLNLFEEGIKWCDEGLVNDPKNVILLETRNICLKARDLGGDATTRNGEDEQKSEGKTKKQIEERAKEGKQYAKIGNACLSSGEFKKALEFYQKYLAIAKEIGDRVGEGRVYGGIACAYLSLGDFQKAVNFYQQRLWIAKEVGDRRGEVIAWRNIAIAYFSLGNFRKAAEYHQLNLSFAKEVGDRAGEGRAYGNLGNAYLSLGDFKKAIDFFTLRLDIAKELGDKVSEGQAYGSLGSAYISLGDFKTAIKYHEWDLDFAKQAGDRSGEGRAHSNLGSAYFYLGSFRKALHSYEVGLGIAREVKDRAVEGRLYGNLGNVYDSLGDVEKAINYHQLRLSTAKDLSNRAGEGRAYGDLSNCYNSLGDFKKAVEYNELWLSIAKEVGDRAGEGRAYGNLGHVFSKTGDVKKAMEYHQLQLSLAKEVGDKAEEGGAYGNLGGDYRRRGDFKKAIENQELSLSIAKALGNKAKEGSCNVNLGNDYFSLGDFEKAKWYYQLGLTIAEEVEDKAGEGRAHGNLGSAFLSLGDFENATEHFQRRLSINKEIGDRAGEGRVYANLGNVHDSLGDRNKAIEYFMLSLGIAKEVGDRNAEGSCYCNLGIAYHSLGDSQKAIENQKQYLSISKRSGEAVGEGRAYENLGEAYYSEGDLRQSVFYGLSVERYNAVRDLLQTKDQWKIGLRDHYDEAYTGLMTVLLKQEKVTEALLAAEQGRAQALKDLINPQYGFDLNPPRPIAKENDIDETSIYLKGTEVVPSARPDVGDSGGGNIGKIVHKSESEKQSQVLEENNAGASEQTSTNKRGINQGGYPQQCDPGIQFIPKRGGPGKNKEETQGNTSNEKGVMPEKVKENKLRTKTKAASDIITSEGGVVRVEDVQLLCPPGAVDNPVSVKMTLEDPVKHYGLIVQKGLENDVLFAAPVFHLEPNGHLFKKPVTLITKIKIMEGRVVCEDGLLVLHGTEARDGKISWQDITQKSIINVANKEVSIEIERFSLIEILWTLTPIRFREIVSRFNLRPLNYTMSFLFNKNSPHHELALVFMSQDIFYDSYYRENDASALVQLRNDGFKLMCSADGPKDKPIYNSESLEVSVRLGEDYKLANNQRSSVDVNVESRVWWSTGLAIRLPLEAIKDVRILCGRIVIQGQRGHTSEYTFCEQDLLGYVKRLLGVEGAIFNLKPIAEKIGTSEEKITQVMKSWRNERDQLELLMEPWLKDTGETKDLYNLRRSLEELKEEDYKVTQRGQMHIRHLRELAVKISDLKIENAELMEYFTGKVQTLCEEVLRDCCIQVENSVEDVEREASSEDYVNYLEVHEKVSPETASKYQQMCSSSEESIVKSFLAIVPQLIQDVKVIFRDEIMPDVQNGLKGLHEEALNQLASNVREAEENNKIRKLVCEVCKILEHLCVKNCDSQHPADLFHKWGSSLGVLRMLDLLKPFFQTCPQHIQLHERLELFACRIRGIISDEVDVDEVFMRDFFDVSSSLIHFAKFDPTKLVRFQLSDSTSSPVTCKSKGVKYDSHNDTFSELFFLRKEEKEELLHHAVARVHTKGRVCNIGAFQSVIMLPASMEEAFQKCMTEMTTATVSGVAKATQEVKDSQTVRVVLCSIQKKKLEFLLDNLKSGELRDVVDWKGSQITPCHLTLRAFSRKPTTVLSLRLIYKWESETLSFDSENFVLDADSSAESACIAEVRVEGLKGPVKPEEVALSLLTSNGGQLSTEPFGSQRTQIHAEKIEYHVHQTYVTGHNCMIGDRATLNTQTSADEQRSLPAGPSSAPLRSLTDHTTEHESTSSEK